MTIDEKITRKGYLEMLFLETGKSREKVSKLISMIAYDDETFKKFLISFRMRHGNNSYAVAHEINRHRYGRAKKLGYIKKRKINLNISEGS